MGQNKTRKWIDYGICESLTMQFIARRESNCLDWDKTDLPSLPSLWRK